MSGTDQRVDLDVVTIRRDIHRFPEVGFTEFRTASIVAGTLDALGWQITLGDLALEPAARLGVPDREELDAAFDRALAEGAPRTLLEPMRGGLTGVVATLAGHAPGPIRAFRFDMDGLPLRESTTTTHQPAIGGFASAHPTQMHACGHDGHVAIGVVLGQRLADRQFPGTVKLIFQPAEEGGRGGAAIAATDVLDDVDLLVCPHLAMGLPSGLVAPEVSGLLANTKLRVRFDGRAAHAAAAPQEGRHALLGAATAVLNIHALTDYAGADTRVNVGKLVSGTSSNIIPDDAVLLLETRATGEVNADLEVRVRRILEGTAHMYDLGVDIEIVGKVPGAPCSSRAIDAVAAAAGAAGLEVASAHYMGASDDATALMNRVQSRGGHATYCVIGADLAGSHHSATFDFDERALTDAVTLFENIARASHAD